MQRDTPFRLAALAAFVICAGAARADGVPDTLYGSWGLPAADPMHGSVVSIYDGARGQVQAEITLHGSDWSCSVFRSVWNPARQRFDSGVDVQYDAVRQTLSWVADPDNPAGGRCTLQATPSGDALDVPFTCARSCSGSHSQRLQRLSKQHLIPPPRNDSSETFCASHDALMQALCTPGDLQQAVDDAHSATEKLQGLADPGDPDARDTRWGWDNAKTLLATVPSCEAESTDPAACLRTIVDNATAERERKIAAYQQRLGAERAASDAARRTLDANAAAAWSGERLLANERFVADLNLSDCDNVGCKAELSASTNYTFGYSQRRGSCIFESMTFAFTAPDRTYVYLEPERPDCYPQDAGPFVNYCRLDLTRRDDGITLALRGPGCRQRCFEVQGDAASLAGDYRAPQNPSFACAADSLPEMRWDEQAVCLDPGLAALDRTLASTYAHAREQLRGARRHAFVNFQQAWIAGRGERCEKVTDRRACLRAAYSERIAALDDPP